MVAPGPGAGGRLLAVGNRDEEVLRLDRSVLRHLATAHLAVVPGMTHLFEEPGAPEAVSRLAAEWFTHRLEEPTANERRPVAWSRTAEVASGWFYLEAIRRSVLAPLAREDA